MNPAFIQTITNTFGADGESWLTALPDLLIAASRRWNLTDINPLQALSYSCVAYARQVETDVVLKLCIPTDESKSEIAALRFYDGRNAVRLLDADPEKGMLLLERLRPGRTLASLKDDGRATKIAVDVMKKLWECSNDFRRNQATEADTTGFIELKDWFDGFKRLRKRFNGKTGPLPKKIVETAESLSMDLLAESKDETLLHGDFHHFNVLESGRGWLAIDPKGVIGPKGYEAGPFLINPAPDFLNRSNPKVQTARRIAILSEMLGLEWERVHAWGFCHAVLSAWWSVEDGGDWTYAIRCAEILQQVKT